uniref:Transmembrane protein n=1 Tax=Panagrellus redivivus TaxID=6233 RepID=A0A7E4V8F7_PANRE
MHIILVLLTFFASILYTNAEISLSIGSPKKVEYDGDHMIIRVNNPEKLNGSVIICLGGTAESSSAHCATGFAELQITLIGQVSIDATVDRDGKSSGMSNIYGEIHYKWDGALEVSLQYKSHDSITVTLANARDWAGGPKKRNYTTVIIVVCCVTFGVVALSCIAFLLICRYGCMNNRKATPATQASPKA